MIICLGWNSHETITLCCTESLSLSFYWQLLAHLHVLINLHSMSLTLIVDLILLIIRHDSVSLHLLVLEKLSIVAAVLRLCMVSESGVEAGRVILIGSSLVASLLLNHLCWCLIETVVIVDTSLLEA